MKQYSWTTEKGAKVQIEVQEVTVNDELAADGWGTKYTEMQVVSFALNCTKFQAEFSRHQGKRAIEFRFQGKKALVLIPEEIARQIWAKEYAAIAAKLDAEVKYAERYNKIMEAMQE